MFLNLETLVFLLGATDLRTWDVRDIERTALGNSFYFERRLQTPAGDVDGIDIGDNFQGSGMNRITSCVFLQSLKESLSSCCVVTVFLPVL